MDDEMTIRGADYIARRMAEQGLTHVFGVTGGGAMHLNDAFGAEPRLATVYFHHEQAAAMAAEGYARIAGRPAVLNVTTGPGSINALERRVRRLHRLDPDARRVGSGEAGNAAAR